MCHCFGMILVWTAGSRGFFEEWAGFVRRVTTTVGNVTAGQNDKFVGCVSRRQSERVAWSCGVERNRFERVTRRDIAQPNRRVGAR